MLAFLTAFEWQHPTGWRAGGDEVTTGFPVLSERQAAVEQHGNCGFPLMSCRGSVVPYALKRSPTVSGGIPLGSLPADTYKYLWEQMILLCTSSGV